jgi:hypothetical protein
MEALNHAIDGADAFAKMMERVVQPGGLGPGKPVDAGATAHDTRRERRARERAQKKARRKASV